MRFASITLLLLTALAVSGQRSDPVFQWAVRASGYSYHADIVYTRANGQELKLDVISIDPSIIARPTLLYIYGGGWVQGTKGSVTLAPLPYLYKGMNVVNVNYRVASEALAPAAVEDCRCALRWIYRHAKDYGFDTSKIVVAGESAGGHLALTTGMLDASTGFDNECPAEEGEPPLKAAAIVSYSGPTDVADLLEGPHQRWFALKWFGSIPNRLELARRLSPVNYVRAGLPPIIQAHGDSDPHVPYEQAVRLHEALDQVGVPNQLITLKGPIHGWAVEKELNVEEQVFDALQKYGVLPDQK
ncbi:MAG: alpha/beta hydrolase fold domain-containing protein [Terriglobales bacterium]